MAETLRIDRWLWFARFFKSRSMASRVCAGRSIRVNGVIAAKPNHMIRPGDVLTFPVGRDIRVIRVEALGVRRGPAPEAQALYEDLAPLSAKVSADIDPLKAAAPGLRALGSGRPTKAQRRALDRLRGDA
ncbi:MAG: RNA-binding S4 domain-containing protein [Alphaproteobacteria bacterium]|jgi:ribosome-associated heat shock protein Hsp15|nr:RNA-binding S4 domain-containing protein [Alphaproteobacteria bacterium]MBT4711163.1 RNA-binding S4 domain-containing protein [Alphaproteobacteria bacterium]MBT5860823.1 RNA-binding S4 domain-containing protein [Alphaproteobacteria bacterium]